MFARRLVPLMLLALVGCIPTSGKKCGSCTTDEAIPEPTSASAEETGCCAKCATGAADSCCADSGKAVAKVELKAVKFAALEEAIRSHKGKVVVVDIWASFCAPCKRDYHHLVDLHTKMAGDGVVCLSVSVDDAEGHDAALAFLTKSNSTFGNFRLDEPNSGWIEKLTVNSLPAVFVYGRDGERVAKLSNDDADNEFTYERDVLPLVKRLAATK